MAEDPSDLLSYDDAVIEYRDFLAALGSVATASPEIEAVAQLLLIDLLKSPEAAIVVHGQPWRMVYDSCETLPTHKPLPAHADELRALLKRAGPALRTPQPDDPRAVGRATGVAT
jgi:hypothetical protein